MRIKRFAQRLYQSLLFKYYSFYPLKNTVVATAVIGTRFADNTKFIYEELLLRNPDFRLIWIKEKKSEYSVPDGIIVAESDQDVMKAYATSKVVLSTTNYPCTYKKRKGQLVINTWHGGLGIKAIGIDLASNSYIKKQRVTQMSKQTDVFISNSNHLSNIYRNSFGYTGPIWKIGYPKNDPLLGDRSSAREKIRNILGISKDTKILLYAPTYRDYNHDGKCFDLDFRKLKQTLEYRDQCCWCIIVKYHPQHPQTISEEYVSYVRDFTSYNDMQELILSADAMISDYSSCIFDAALVGLECHTFATDFNCYKLGRGVYYEMQELPFPYSRNNEELMDNVLNYSISLWHERWEDFKKKVGLVEKGCASKCIADKICDFMNGKHVKWENTDL